MPSFSVGRPTEAIDPLAYGQQTSSTTAILARMYLRTNMIESKEGCRWSDWLKSGGNREGADGESDLRKDPKASCSNGPSPVKLPPPVTLPDN